jgi:glycogen phosphorylase/synthase
MNAEQGIAKLLFDVSWEVCNKVGGVHSVLATKAPLLSADFNDNFLSIGPDVYRETGKHPEFLEDPTLYASWKKQAEREGLRVRIGHWKIPSKPTVIIVDFTTFISQKNEILSFFWDKYQVDSISGEWDYVEPVLFGYAAGKVIESFTRYHFTLKTPVIAHFQEWLTGAGVLYLKAKAPHIATVYTAHDTLIGRYLARESHSLYGGFADINIQEISFKNNLVSKLSIEKASAFNADVFTTVSNITAQECANFLGKPVDFITPNGINPEIIEDSQLQKEKAEARYKLLRVAEAITNMPQKEDSLIISHVGRADLENEGVDIFLEAMDLLAQTNELKRPILAFCIVNVNHYGPRKEVLARLKSGNPSGVPDYPFLSHGLHDAENLPIYKKLKSIPYDAAAESNSVSIIFIPTHLDGADGVFNLKYSQILKGFDLTVYPSYYKPWGYHPLESLSFSVPSICTSITGFGDWIRSTQVTMGDAIRVVERNDTNDQDVIREIASIIREFNHKSTDQLKEASRLAGVMAQAASWSMLIKEIYKAYDLALSKVNERKELFNEVVQIQHEYHPVESSSNGDPIWHSVSIQSSIPEKFTRLIELSRNIWWSWSWQATDLFASIDPEIWMECGENPVVLLDSVHLSRFKELEKDESFFQRYQEVLQLFDAYMAEPYIKHDQSIAYFSMEYGFHDSIKIYSGGLGILAGDYLKEASDSRVNMTGIGLLYRTGYFKQIISLSGEQVADYPRQEFAQLPLIAVLDDHGVEIRISVVLPGRTVYAKVWELRIGRIKLFLLDTDLEENLEADRSITNALYGGDNENRLKQEMILGVGGIRALNAMKINPKLYHCNEGHAAFIGLERLRKFIFEDNLSFEESREIVRASTLFTTHTPVPAGHDSFSEDLLRTYMSHYPYRLKISWREFMSLGKVEVDNPEEQFSMSVLALNLSQEVNGVSWLHGEVSKEMFLPMFPGYFKDELHISYVTNGVHYESWAASDWQRLYRKTFGEGFLTAQHKQEHWNKIYEVDDQLIWSTHLKQKKNLIDYLKKRVEANWLRRHESPHRITEVLQNLNENSLIIGFARRFATYKRAYLLFTDIQRLDRLINQSGKPVIFLFAGKAHPKDIPGQELIKKVVEVSRLPEFLGKILFLENYEIGLAKKLVQGVDIWMNTPTRPLEASGTSGMKAVMNGGLHFSVLDGWWVEGYQQDAGWALPLERTYQDQQLQNNLDAEMIYNIFETEILPGYYSFNEQGVPVTWVKYMKNSIAHVAPKFTMKRMIEDYKDRFYGKLYDRSVQIQDDEHQLAQSIALWKKKMLRNWDEIQVEELHAPYLETYALKIGETYDANVRINLAELLPEDIGLELLMSVKDKKGQIKIVELIPFQFDKNEGKQAFYHVKFTPAKPGSVNYGIRLFAQNPYLPHRQDFGLTKWL